MTELKEKFLAELIKKPPEKVASFWMLERIPHLFKNDIELYINWKHVLANKIQVDSASILLTGSACVGVSLNPYKNYKSFDLESDVDVAIVSEYFFNESWRYMRSLGSEIHGLPRIMRESITEHVKRYIYWGTIATDKILPLLPFGKIWLKALEDMSKIEPTEDRTINARIYKDFESLRAYHVANLKNLRAKELGEGE